MSKIMVTTSPETYRKYMTYDNNRNNLLYVILTKALYRILKEVLLFYKKLWSDLKALGFRRIFFFADKVIYMK